MNMLQRLLLPMPVPAFHLCILCMVALCVACLAFLTHAVPLMPASGCAAIRHFVPATLNNGGWPWHPTYLKTSPTANRRGGQDRTGRGTTWEEEEDRTGTVVGGGRPLKRGAVQTPMATVLRFGMALFAAVQHAPPLLTYLITYVSSQTAAARACQCTVMCQPSQPGMGGVVTCFIHSSSLPTAPATATLPLPHLPFPSAFPPAHPTHLPLYYLKALSLLSAETWWWAWCCWDVCWQRGDRAGVQLPACCFPGMAQGLDRHSLPRLDRLLVWHASHCLHSLGWDIGKNIWAGLFYFLEVGK